MKKSALIHAPELVLLCVLVLLHTLLDVHTGDFEWFHSVLNEYQSLPEFLVYRYFHWTSRLIIEACLVLLTHVPIVWHIIDIALVLLLFVSIRSIINPTNIRQVFVSWFVLLLFAYYPIRDMSTAGWMATTMNYSWPLALGTFSLSIMVQHIRANSTTFSDVVHEPTKQLRVVAYLATIYACSAEQSALLLLGFSLVFTAFAYKQKMPSSVLLIHCGISLLSTIFILTCPGNSNRNAREMQKWWPNTTNFKIHTDFSTFSQFEKFFIGLATTLDRYFYQANALMTVLVLLLLVVAIYELRGQRHYHCKVAVSMCIAALLVIRFLLEVAKDQLPTFLQKILHNQVYDFTLKRILLTLCEIVISVLILAVFFWLYGRTLQFAITFLVLSAGFLSRVILGFSASVFVSGTRTFIFTDFALLCVIGLLVVSQLNDSATTEDRALVVSAIIPFSFLAFAYYQFAF